MLSPHLVTNPLIVRFAPDQIWEEERCLNVRDDTIGAVVVDAWLAWTEDMEVEVDDVEDVEEVEEIEMEGEVRVGVALLFVGDAVSKFKIDETQWANVVELQHREKHIYS